MTDLTIVRIVRKDSNGSIGWKAYLRVNGGAFHLQFTQSLRFGAPIRILADGAYAPVSVPTNGERLSLEWIRAYLTKEGYAN